MLKSLTIHYVDSDKINESFDKALEKFLSDYGLKRWASGVEIGTGIRDIAFDIPHK